MAFKKPTGKPVKKVSRYAGVKSAADRMPILGEGEGVLRWLGTETGQHPKKHNTWVRVSFEIVDGDFKTAKLAPLKVGDQCVLIESVAGSGSATYGLERLKAMVVGFSGVESDDDYDTLDPDGEFMSAALEGESNDFSGYTLEGRLAAVVGRRGNEKIDDETGKGRGEYFCSHSWAIVPDEAQDVPSFPAQVEAS
jgi:hypothetical protein